MTTQEIQAQLDSGYCKLPVGTFVVNAPLIRRHNCLFEGSGPRTVVRASGNFPAMKDDPTTANIYGSYIRDMTLEGGVVLDKLAQHTAIENVWFTNPNGDGLIIRGTGERSPFFGCVFWGSKGNGVTITVPADSTYNGILFDFCNMQNNKGYGVVLQTEGRYAELLDTVFRDCTIQGNGVTLQGDLNCDNKVDVTDISLAQSAPEILPVLSKVLAEFGTAAPQADILIRGAVYRTRFDGCWVEAVKTGRGIYQEGINFSNGWARPTTTTPNTTFSECKLQWATSVNCDPVELSTGARLTASAKRA